MMTKRISVGFTLLAAIGMASAVIAHGTRPIAPTKVLGPRPVGPTVAAEPSPIESLDRCIQERLHRHRGFGMDRIAAPLLDFREFRPESPSEVESVAKLLGSGWTVGIRLGSRSLLGPAPVPAPVEAKAPDEGGFDSDQEDRDISQPIAIQGTELPADMPGPDALREIARRALAGSDSADSASGTVGRWSVDARVVRADRESCLRCHSGQKAMFFPPGQGVEQDRLKIGDAMGVAIYIYGRKSPGP